MSALHCVVVWEWWDGTCWLPHPPAVAQQLERAHAKRLTRVVLADADPALAGHHVNLRTHTQTRDSHDGGVAVECGVRRSCYNVWSPAGRGARWEWATAPPHADSVWEQLSMDMQCRLEECWTRGDASCEVTTTRGAWVAAVGALSARGPGGARRVLRRVSQAPYPLTKSTPPSPAPQHHARHNTVQGRRAHPIPQQHTGSSTKSNVSAASVRTVVSASERRDGVVSASERRDGVISASERAKCERDRDKTPHRDKGKHNIRQILHNLNIFNIKQHDSRQGDACVSPTPLSEGSADFKRDADSTSTRSGRRPSQDTVSTYLSHETVASDVSGQPAVGDLLNCSVGSDDVFEIHEPPPPARPKTPSSNGSIVGVDAASSSVSVYVRVVERVQWGAVCPLCLRALEGGGRVAVSLARCQHMLHLHCLNRDLTDQRGQGPLYIKCGVCGEVYGGDAPEEAAVEADGGSVAAGGDQPAGSMAWCVQHRPLPNHPADTNTIQITYNMMSGTQGPEHPSPGRPYYAVGFPRYSYLPDTPLGRQVLNLLCVAWERRLLFTIGRSQTTGREDVVAWAGGVRLRSERTHYAAGARDSAHYLHQVIRQLALLGVTDKHEINLYQELQ